MYVQGVSTRRVAAVVEKLCGTGYPLGDLLDHGESRCCRRRSAGKLAQSTLGCFPYVYLDACYESVRQNGKVDDAAVLVAIGVDEQGKRQVLGVSVALSKHEVHWCTFRTSLQQRGLSGMRLIVSDDHSGLKAARRAVFGGVPRYPLAGERCQFHLQQNAQTYATKQ